MRLAVAEKGVLGCLVLAHHNHWCIIPLLLGSYKLCTYHNCWPPGHHQASLAGVHPPPHFLTTPRKFAKHLIVSLLSSTASSAHMVYLLLLGVAQDAGVPQAGCSCENCSAVWAGTMPRQFAVSPALVDETESKCWLIDCTPDFKDQYHLLQQWLGAARRSNAVKGGVGGRGGGTRGVGAGACVHRMASEVKTPIYPCDSKCWLVDCTPDFKDHFHLLHH